MPPRDLRQILAKEKRAQEGRGRSERLHSEEFQFNAVVEEKAGTAQDSENPLITKHEDHLSRFDS